MKSTVVIDTNVLLVASGLSDQMSEACRIACMSRLQKAKGEIVVIDDKFLILGEYGNKLDDKRRPQSIGREFITYLLKHIAYHDKVSTVVITPTDREKTKFKEFPPDDKLESQFDPADRKFVAVAYSHCDKPPIVQAADSKWLGWEEQLNRHGIKLEVICREELEKLRDRKIKKLN